MWLFEQKTLSPCPLNKSDATRGEATPPFFKICGEAATATLGAKGPSNLRTFRPIGPVNPKNLFYKHDGRVPRHFRHLERSCMSLWETDGKRYYDALSREISRPNAS